MQLHDLIVASSAPGRRFNRAGLRTRTAILRAAIAVIAGHSLSGTTIERVAEKAGIAVGTVMLHFKRTEALLVAVDRKSVGSGKSVSGRVDLGGRRYIKKKKKR